MMILIRIMLNSTKQFTRKQKLNIWIILNTNNILKIKIKSKSQNI